MKMPELTPDQLGALRDSIQRDGVQYPVLLDRHGAPIDGKHRQKVCAELGVDCPTKTLDVDDDTASRLRVSLNLARRQLSTLDQYEMVAWLAEQYAPAAAAAALGRKVQGGKDAGRGRPKQVTPVVGVTYLEASEDVAEQIRAEASAAGRTVRVSKSTVDRARKVAKLSPEKKADIRAGKVSVTAAIGESYKKKPKTKVPAHNGSASTRPSRLAEHDQISRVRAIDAECQYQSMLNAPAAKLNLPLIRRAEKIMECLTELIALDPTKAVSQLPAERCREFGVRHAAWWSEFARLCEERRAAETPDLATRPFRPMNHALNTVVLGGKAIPMEERGLPPAVRTVLEWVRAQPEPVTVVEVCVGLRNRSKGTVETHLSTLRVSGLVEVVGKAGRASLFASPPP